MQNHDITRRMICVVCLSKRTVRNILYSRKYRSKQWWRNTSITMHMTHICHVIFVVHVATSFIDTNTENWKQSVCPSYLTIQMKRGIVEVLERKWNVLELTLEVFKNLQTTPNRRQHLKAEHLTNGQEDKVEFCLNKQIKKELWLWTALNQQLMLTFNFKGNTLSSFYAMFLKTS